MESLDITQGRRLALLRAGLLKPELTGMPRRARGAGRRARKAAYRVLGRFGYLQLDTVSVAGARTHGIVLLSRIEGLEPQLAEQLLAPREPLFEYWGHEASWLPMELYPLFEFRRREFRRHPWWGDVLEQHAELAEAVVERVRAEGPLRSTDLRDDVSQADWWGWGPTKKVLSALWSCGRLAIRRRVHFHRQYDLAERVIPAEIRAISVERPEAIRRLLLRALAGHGWAATGTLAATWRFRNMGEEVRGALAQLAEAGEVVACTLRLPAGSKQGWVRPGDLELVGRLTSLRPRRDTGVLLSPFDPVLWDRGRVRTLFRFEQTLEIYKPKPKRRYGYYCLPVLAGDRLVSRVDLKAARSEGILRVLSAHYESGTPSAADRAATDSALARYAGALDLRLAEGQGRV